MKYCTRCLYPENHPLNLTFDEEGICSGCRVHEEKDHIDWNLRKDMLRTLLNEFRSSSARSYDCIVPVSGGRDSYFIVHTLKNDFGMNPLLVTYNKQYNTKVGIRNLAYLQAIFGCDLISCTVNPERVKIITKETLRQRASIYWHCIAGQTAFPVRTAVNQKVPLIIWGQQQGCDQVGMYSHYDYVEMTRRYRHEHDLLQLEAEELVSNSDGAISMDDIKQYIYPHDKEIESVGVRGIYLSNYMRWDTKMQHEKMINMYGYETRRQDRTFDPYCDPDCFHYSGAHDYIKHAKWGYSKVTDHAVREIRFGRMSRVEAVAYVNRHEQAEPADLRLFLEWLGIDRRHFDELVDRHRDPRIWKCLGGSSWNLLDHIRNHLNDEGVGKVKLANKGPSSFIESPSRHPGEIDNSHTLIGRACVDEGALPEILARFPVPG